MTISYKNLYRDFVAFHFHHFSRSPLAILVTVGLFSWLTFQNISPLFSNEQPVHQNIFAFIISELYFAILLLVLWGIWIPFCLLFTLFSKKNKTLTAERTIQIGENSFISESSYSKLEVRWNAVQKLARSRNYIFIYLSQSSALVVPRRVFQDIEKWNLFFEFCKTKVNQNS